MSELLKLHVGGVAPREGWKILNIQPGPHVDFVGSGTDLSAFANGSASEIYLSHVLEHLDYHHEVFQALAEFRRVLTSGGRLMIGVPDLEVLCHLMLAPFLNLDAKFHVMRMIYGGQIDAFDYHKAGYTFPFLAEFLHRAGFQRIRRLESFQLFNDTTELKFRGVPISLNVEAFNPPA